MRKRIGWVAVVGVLLALSGSGALPEKAVCTDCRPAPERWACLSVLRSCNMDYKECRDLPYTPPGEEGNH